MAISSKPKDPKEIEAIKKAGIITFHAYSLIDAKEITVNG
jgi:hypothetical protein